jgi:hypothetical protein
MLETLMRLTSRWAVVYQGATGTPAVAATQMP